jgi:hypothetical protein
MIAMNPTPRQRQVEAIARWLAVFVRPGQVTELRALHLANGRKLVSAFFTGDRLRDMAARAVDLEKAGARGVYFTPNPLRPDMAISKRCAKDQDVVARRWLLIDCDPYRFGPDGNRLEGGKVSSTDAERAAAWQVLDRCRGSLEAAGFRGAVVGDSGNGWHLCYPIDLPNNDDARDKVKALLRGLDARCSDGRAEVDTSCFNAGRIWKLYGTLTRKGPCTDERPYRWARLVEVGGEEVSDG